MLVSKDIMFFFNFMIKNIISRFFDLICIQNSDYYMLLMYLEAKFRAQNIEFKQGRLIPIIKY